MVFVTEARPAIRRTLDKIREFVRLSVLHQTNEMNERTNELISIKRWMHTAQAHHKQKHHFVYALPGIFFLCTGKMRFVCMNVRVSECSHTKTLPYGSLCHPSTALLTSLDVGKPCVFHHYVSQAPFFSSVFFSTVLTKWAFASARINVCVFLHFYFCFTSGKAQTENRNAEHTIGELV